MDATRLWVAIGLVAGCSPYDGQIKDIVPILSVAPLELDFGDVGVLYTDTQPVYLTNAGLDDLEVTVSLEGEAFSIESLGLLVIAAGENRQIPVTFTPDTYQGYEGTLLLESNDQAHPEWIVPLAGTGADVPTPDIEVVPLTLDTALLPGASAMMGFTIHNVGDGDLDLGEIVWQGDPAFTPQFVPSRQTVRASQSTELIFQYTAPDTLGQQATATIPSNDPDELSVTVQLLGNGGDDFAFPEAIIDCPSIVPLAGPTTVPLSGLRSNDPAGALPLEYAWTVLSRPPGADLDTPLDPDDTPEVDLYVDVAGTWEVQLVVTNQLDAVSPPALCTFSTFPEDDLRVELSWDSDVADIDLHLAQSGHALYEDLYDCNWCNQNPDWGANGDSDDPRHDLDARGGRGPENINIEQPAGTYDIRVHYYPADDAGPVLATVHVWIDGVDVYTDTQVLEYRDVWDVGTADTEYGSVVPVGGISTTLATGCP